MRPSDLLPVIRPVQFWQGFETAAEIEKRPELEPLEFGFSPNLSVFLSAQENDFLRYVTFADASSLGLSAEEAQDQAITNLNGVEHWFSVTQNSDNFFSVQISRDGNLDHRGASALLLRRFWQEIASRDRRPLLSMAPNREWVNFFHLSSPGSLEGTRRAARLAYDDEEDAFKLSPELFRWDKDRWCVA